jgi:hypothetical protein
VVIAPVSCEAPGSTSPLPARTVPRRASR